MARVNELVEEAAEDALSFFGSIKYTEEQSARLSADIVRFIIQWIDDEFSLGMPAGYPDDFRTQLITLAPRPDDEN